MTNRRIKKRKTDRESVAMAKSGYSKSKFASDLE